MADVKIIDIDGEQWDIKDQEARNIIAVLEQKAEENANIIEKLNKDVQKGFLARWEVKKIGMYPFETCFISGYVDNVGPYMAILASIHDTVLDIRDVYGLASQHITVKALGGWNFELLVRGRISIFGFAKSLS